MALAFELASSSGLPKKTAMLLHGLLGSARNWRSFAKRLPPDWRVVAVDLRNHGRSADIDFDPPHDIPSTARDIANLINLHPELRPDILIGHSMGGKVALEFLKTCKAMATSPPKQVWVLDSQIGQVSGRDKMEVERLMEAIPDIPDPFPSRSWLVGRLISLGFSQRVADWMGTNTRTISSSESTWLFNARGVCDMFASCWQTDHWSVLEEPHHSSKLAVVRALQSDIWSPQDIRRLEHVCRKNADCVSYRVLDNASHWLHADNPAGLAQILVHEDVHCAGLKEQLAV